MVTIPITVQRGTATSDNNSTTTSPTTTFGSLASTVVFNTSNRYMNAGRNDANAGNLETDDLSGGIHLSAVNTIDIDREVGSIVNLMRFDWESWEYTGSGGGPDEFIVRGRVKLTLASTSTTTTIISGINNIDRCIPFITGILCDATLDNADQATAIAWMSGTNILNIRRGGNTNTTKVYVTVVEFTGSNWSIFHGRQESGGLDSGDVILKNNADGLTGTTGDVISWDNAIIFHQQVANQLNGVDDAISDTSAVFEPTSGLTTSVNWTFATNHVNSAAPGSQGEIFVHILKHSVLTVTRFTDNQNIVNATVTFNIGLVGLSNSSVVVSRQSSGSGTAYGRGWVNYQLLTTTTLQLWIHRTGNTISTKIQIINFVGPDVAVQLVNSDNTIALGQMGNTAIGFGFGATQGSGKIEMVQNQDYTGTIVAQIVTTWGDTSIIFDAVQGMLLEGTNFVFVTNNLGQRNLLGLAIILGLIDYKGTVLSLSPDHNWTLDNTYFDSVSTLDMTASLIGTQFFVTPPICENNSFSWLIDDISDRRGTVDSSDMNASDLTERTMGGWIMLGTVQKSLASVYKEGAQINNIAFLTGVGNVLFAQLADTGDDNVQAYSDFKLDINRPYHIIFRFSYLQTPKQFRLFIDGKLQTKTSGNDLTSSRNALQSHVGNIIWGDPDSSLEMGGSDITFKGRENIQYAQWATWSSFVSDLDIKEKLFRRGATPKDIIVSGTQTQMQASLDAFSNTTRTNWPLSFRIEESTDGNLKLLANNIIFDPKITDHLEYRGTNTLTWVNVETSNANITKTFSPRAGASIIIIETAPQVFNVTNFSGSPVPGVQVSTFDSSNKSALMSTLTNENGVASDFTFEFISDTPIFFRIRRSSNSVSFDVSTDINSTTNIITINAGHFFNTGEDIIYDINGGSIDIGLINGTVYYINSITSTTLSLHPTALDAINDTSRINLSAGSTEIQILKSIRFIPVSGSSTISSTGININIVLNEDKTAL